MQEARSSCPNPPWFLRGNHWGALLPTCEPVGVPNVDNLRPVFSHRLAVALLEYKSGTLAYNEFIVGVLVWRGWTPALCIRDIWVDSRQSLEGGRSIWNLPKQMATFTRTDSGVVTVADEQGMVAEVDSRLPTTHIPWMPGRLSFIGTENKSVVRAYASWRGRVSLSPLRVSQWSGRFRERLAKRATVGFSSRRFSMTVYGPRT